MKICLVSSCGGHLAELRALMPAFGAHDHFYVVNDRIALPRDMEGRTIFIRHAERDWRVLANFAEAWTILRRERPDLILSTGAGPAVPFALVGKLLSIPTIFVEISAQVQRPSLTGRLLYPVADRFFYQWPGLERFYPKASLGRLL
jgi:UDP-N-acetylglucosamine:LPS N-acetylglucosamine transferase